MYKCLLWKRKHWTSKFPSRIFHIGNILFGDSSAIFRSFCGVELLMTNIPSGERNLLLKTAVRLGFLYEIDVVPRSGESFHRAFNMGTCELEQWRHWGEYVICVTSFIWKAEKMDRESSGTDTRRISAGTRECPTQSICQVKFQRRKLMMSLTILWSLQVRSYKFTNCY